MTNQNFDLQTFTELYLKDNRRWVYLYRDTFYELSELLEEKVDINEYFVKEVSVSEMISVIKTIVPLEWFLENDICAARIRRKGDQFEVFTSNDMREPEGHIANVSDLEGALRSKLETDLFWLRVQNIKP